MGQMRNKIFVCFVLLFCVGCAGKTVVINNAPVDAPTQKQAVFSVVIEGLEPEYYSTVTRTLKNIDNYVRHTIILSSKSTLEVAVRVNGGANVAEGITEKLNALFMSMSKTVTIRILTDTIVIKVTDW